jgi:hypothetical protein
MTTTDSGLLKANERRTGLTETRAQATGGWQFLLPTLLLLVAVVLFTMLGVL